MDNGDSRTLRYSEPMPNGSAPSAKQRHGEIWWQVTVVMLPAVLAYVILACLVTRVPLIDDYWHLLAFAIQFEKAATAGDKLSLLFNSQVGPYKLILDHAIVSLQLLLFGKLNFPVLIFLGNLTPLGIFALLWKNSPTRQIGRYSLLTLLPVSLLLFSLNYAETLDWAISGLQQPAVILFSLATVHFLVKRDSTSRDFALACMCGLLASATYANGVLVWVVGVVYLVLQGWKFGWQWGRALAWCVCAAAGMFVYLYHYHSSGLTSHAGLWQQFVFFVSFCGGGMENMHHRPVPYISLALGALVLAVCVHAVYTRYYQRNPYFFYSSLWLLLTAAVVANARVGMGMQLSLSSRYKIYCDLLLVSCYVYGLDRWSQREKSLRMYLTAAIAASLVFCIGGDIAGSVILSTRKERAEAAMRAYLAHPESASPMFLVEDVLSPEELSTEDLARQQLNEARALGIYTPPVLP